MNCSILYSSQNPGIITNGLVAYYQFENPNCWLGTGVRTVRDLSGFSNFTGSFQSAAAISGSTVTSGPYYIPPSLICPGATTRGLLCQMSSSTQGKYIYNPPDGYTHAAWAYFTGTVGQTGCIMVNGSSAQRVGQMSLYSGSGGHTGMEYYDNSVGEYFSANLTGSTWPGTPINGWHYWAITVTPTNTGASSSLSFYRDGTLINTLAGQAPLQKFVVANTNLLFGYDYYSTYFRGYINCATIYKRPLSAIELTYNYTALKWRFGI
jgi:hypothetical protein